jgi:hypothetical protein
VIDVVARLLVRGEIVLLAMVYAYFVLTDGVPLIAFVLIALVWLARWRVTGALTRRTLFDVPILLLLVWLPVSFSVTIDPALSLPKVYGVLLSVAFFYAIVNAIRTRDDLATATVWLVVVCAGIALAGSIGTDWAQDKIVSASFIYDRLPRVIQGIPRSIAGGFARNGVGGTLAFTIPLLAALLVTGDRRLPSGRPIFDRRLPIVQIANRKSQIFCPLSFVLHLGSGLPSHSHSSRSRSRNRAVECWGRSLACWSWRCGANARSRGSSARARWGWLRSLRWGTATRCWNLCCEWTRVTPRWRVAGRCGSAV